ncbi:hypothetical protein B4U79_06161 [Dinothrombium tinctorium]|uniref:IlvB-like protein n=1 Tax=Dinothrombium tinctorium TaxID=1965070 RepID=A0A3S3SCF8_9ACAR|nr:hypothetical protein B4U79_00539 [Dinothrombium tinctorium]RWS13469.1 hypothetical protein B4U79_03303 [Dinothrombium tinctorium]RWS13984.1 hypothetical protein B4U79_11623 [Dinothrombium tinctorium]RWS13992.1 hypothetical protein B4U79_06161 [Dinothrombium tinctorium]
MLSDEQYEHLLSSAKDVYMYLHEIEYYILFKNSIYYVFLTICALQTFYPIFMILAMVIRQIGIFAHFFHKVDHDSNRHGGELIASVLKAHGVDYVFTLSGGHISPVLTGAEKAGIRVIDTRHEVTTVFAADAVYRLSGVPGVAVVTAGPGLTNTVTAVKNAQMAESAVVLLGGCPSTLLKGRGALQDIDQMSLFKSLTKWQKTVTKVRDLVPVMREAFRQAQSGTPGPVFVELPLDTLYPYPIVKKEVVSKSSGNSLRSRLVNWYLNHYLENLFAGAFDVEREIRPWPVEIPFPKKAQMQKVVELVSKAKKPLIVLGSQSTLPPIGATELRKHIESLGIPCFLGGMSRGLLGPNSPLHMRQSRGLALKEADVVILGGAVCDFRLNYGKSLSSKSKIIAVNRSKQQLYKNAGIFWNPTLALQADVGQFFKELAEKLGNGKLSVSKDWIDSLKERDNAKESKNLEMALQPADKHLNPVKVLFDLEHTLSEDTILIADGGDFVATASYIVRPRKPLSWLDPGAFGTLGCGAGFALGAKLVKPDADVCVIFGDGSLGYSLIEFDTFYRHKLPIRAVIGNDACWTQIAREQVNMLGSDVGCNLIYTTYEQAAEGLGAKGFVLDAGDEEKLKEVFNKSRQLNLEGHPVLINCLIGKTKFREGSISV